MNNKLKSYLLIAIVFLFVLMQILFWYDWIIELRRIIG